MPQKPPAQLQNFETLLNVMQTLAGPDGCPWDKEQTHKSLAPYLIEEAHEVVEAIVSGSDDDLKEELGDLLLQIVFHSELARQQKRFTVSDVIFSINDKMIRRHPHVFSDGSATTSEEVKANWDKIKKTEKGDATDNMGGPVQLPALQRSFKIGEKTKRAKFDWPNFEGVRKKLDEELGELDQSIQTKNSSEIEHEIGDVLFTLAQLARHLKLDPEASLRSANRRFENRYQKMMEIAKNKNLNWEGLSNDQKEELWQEAKKLAKS